MRRFWNFTGWMAIGIILPGMIYATSADPENSDTPGQTHAADCRICRNCVDQPSLPLVIDGDNVRVVQPGSARDIDGPRPVTHHL